MINSRVAAMVVCFQFRQEYLDTLYRYAKFQYECGNYSGAAEYLYFFRVLVSFSFHYGQFCLSLPVCPLKSLDIKCQRALPACV